MKLARRIEELAESATLAVAAKAAKLKASGVDVVGFGAGEPDFVTPSHICDAAIKALRDGHTGYGKPASGLPRAKEAVRNKFLRDNGIDYSADEVIVTAGGKMACYLLIQSVVDEGDEVVIPRPYWVSYPEMVGLAGGKSVYVQGDAAADYKLTPADLEAVLTDRTRLVMLNSPSNPSGVTYDPDEMRALGELLTKRDVVVMSDELYDQLLYRGQEHLSYAAISDAAKAQCVTINGASKSYAMTGWRLGFAGGPAPIIKAMAKLQSQTTSGAANFTQFGLIEALSGDHAAVEAMRTQFEKRGGYMWERLSAMDGVTCPKPTGAFYCFPNVGGTYERLGVRGSVEFAARLLEDANVAVVPGVAFGLDDHVRLSFATSLEQIEKGLDRMEQFLAG